MDNKYFTELVRCLQANGIISVPQVHDRLMVMLNDQPILSVSPRGEVFLLPAGGNNPEASELYHKVAQTADDVYVYVEAVQTAPLLHASGLSEEFHLLSDFGGAVLAGREMENGWGKRLGLSVCYLDLGLWQNRDKSRTLFRGGFSRSQAGFCRSLRPDLQSQAFLTGGANRTLPGYRISVG